MLIEITNSASFLLTYSYFGFITLKLLNIMYTSCIIILLYNPGIATFTHAMQVHNTRLGIRNGSGNSLLNCSSAYDGYIG